MISMNIKRKEHFVEASQSVIIKRQQQRPVEAIYSTPKEKPQQQSVNATQLITSESKEQ